MAEAATEARGVPDKAAPYATERSALLQFMNLLERERQSLATPDADALNSIVAEKMALLQQLDRLRDSRLQPESAAQRAAWAELRVLTTAARRVSDSNARLLAVQRAHCQARLRVLHQGTALEAVYGADGLGVGANR